MRALADMPGDFDTVECRPVRIADAYSQREPGSMGCEAYAVACNGQRFTYQDAGLEPAHASILIAAVRGRGMINATFWRRLEKNQSCCARSLKSWL